MQMAIAQDILSPERADRQAAQGMALAEPPADFLPVKGFLESFAEHLESDPDRAACYWVKNSGPGLEARPISFRELADRAWRTWLGLEARGVRPGDPVLLCLGHPGDMLAALLASMAGGFVPVPLPSLGDFGVAAAFRDRVVSVAGDCRPRLALADRRSHRALADAGLEIPVLEPGEVEAGLELPPGRSFPSRPRGTVAFIQYTSGSTGTPRGVVVTHENLSANCKTIGLASAVGPEDRMVTWLPLHHDMGLVGGLLFPLYWRIPTYLMAPVSFIGRPTSWLAAIHRFRGTYSVAPNFAYSLCLRKVPERELAGLDLSSWRLAFNGAEPIDAETVQGFCQRFRPYGFRAEAFYPVYGLAEATLAVAFPAPGSAPVFDTVDRAVLCSHGRAVPADPAASNSVTHVSVGHPVPGHQVRILDPETRRPLPDRQVGEIVVTGPSVSPRYFNQEPNAQRDELRTGDLGYMADGHLYVIDRLKDLIIVAGQNFAPSDVESCASRVAGVRRGRVVAFPTPGELGTDRVHIAAELDLRVWRQQRHIQEEVVRSVRERFGLAVEDVLLLPPGHMPRTTSGKVQRRACRNLYLEGRMAATVPLGTRLAGVVHRARRWVAVATARRSPDAASPTN